MIINNEFLKQQDACGGGVAWFNDNFSGDVEFLEVVEKLIEQEEYSHLDWLVQELLDYHCIEDSGNEYKVKAINKKIYSTVKNFGTPKELVEVGNFDVDEFVIDRPLNYMSKDLHLMCLKGLYEMVTSE